MNTYSVNLYREHSLWSYFSNTLYLIIAVVTKADLSEQARLAWSYLLKMMMKFSKIIGLSTLSSEGEKACLI